MKTQKGSVAIILLIILLIAGGGYLYIKSKTKTMPNTQVQEEPKEVIKKNLLKNQLLISLQKKQPNK